LQAKVSSSGEAFGIADASGIGAGQHCLRKHPKSEAYTKMKNLLLRLWREEEGQDLTEYALLLVLIALVAIAAITQVGQAVSNVFSNAAANLSTS
jgi:pilus assembly protein Flp/PilA